jgi:dipeptide/tripeptide permease
MPTQGSCRPCVCTTVGAPSRSIERRSMRMLDVGFTASLIAAISSKIGLTATAVITALVHAIPFNTFFYIIAIGSFVGLFIFFLCLADVFN